MKSNELSVGNRPDRLRGPTKSWNSSTAGRGDATAAVMTGLKPASIVKAYMDVVPAGSHLLVTHFHRGTPEAPELERKFIESVGSGWYSASGDQHERSLRWKN